jgi:hypothetical protein
MMLGHPSPDARLRSVKPVLPEIALILAFGGLAFVMLISVFLAPKQISFAVVAAIAFGIVFALVGNQRLFCLWGLVLTAPLTMSKAFVVNPHMGGASAITIDLDDVFLVLLLGFIVRDYVIGVRREVRLSPVLFWWGALILLGVMDVIVGPLRKFAMLEIIRMIKCYVLFFVVINELLRVRKIAHYVVALGVGVALQATCAIIQFLFKANLGLQFLGEPAQETTDLTTKGTYAGHADIFRAGGLFSHPNLLAGYMAILLPILIALLLSRVAFVYKAIAGLVIVLGLATMIITLSRSGWMSLAAAFIVLMAAAHFHPHLRRRYRGTKTAILVISVVALALASGPIVKRLTHSDPGAINFRFDMMDTAWAIIADKPIFGLGLNSFVPEMPVYSKFHGPAGVTREYGKIWPVVHNSYLITWTEQGTVGFCFLMGMYICILWTGYKTTRYFISPLLYSINIGACCGIVAIMFDGLGSFFIDESASERVFWLCVGLIFAIHYWTIANARQILSRIERSRPGDDTAVGESGLGGAGVTISGPAASKA